MTTVPVLTATAASAASGPAGVSNAVSMGGGATGKINDQSGAFQTALPLASLPGRGGAGVELVLGYDQTAAGAGVNRSGLGVGFGLGKAFVDPSDGGTLHTPGGSFKINPGDKTGTGLKRYLLKDMTLRDEAGTLPARDGVGPVEYRWVLSYDDGRKNFFSAEGDLVAERDVYGHQTAFEWELAGDQHRLVRVTDAWGQAVTFDYGTENKVTITSPVRSDGQQPEVVLHLSDGWLTSVVYPEGQETKLAWDYTPGDKPGRLLTRIEAPTTAVTRISYDEPHGFPVAASLKVTDAGGKNLTAERTFSLKAAGENDGHDFTGRGQYASADDLFDSADPDYRYTTELSDGRSTVRSVYNSLHLLKERTALLNTQDEPKPVRTQQLEYAGERDGGQAPPPASDLPANYGKPVRATVTVHDPATGKTRSTTETARFDDHGREVERTDVTGTKTVTEYDPTALDTQTGEPAGYGLPLRVTVTGTDGAQTITENTLTEDRKSVTAVKQLVKNKDDAQPSARTTTSYQINEDGEVTAKTLEWAEGARPEGAEGPDRITETYSSTADTDAHTRTHTVESAAGVSTQTTDLVTGQVIRATDTQGRTAETAYDDAGRAVTRKLPGGPKGEGLVTSIEYTPSTTTVTSPGREGEPHVTVEERDLLGRVIKQTDNVSDGEFTSNPAARVLQTVQFEDEGRTVKFTDGAGRTTVTTNDDLGRPVKTTAPNGVTQVTAYQDALTADTSAKTTFVLPAGETDPGKAAAATTVTLDNAERPVSSAASFADGTEQPPTSTAYDSLGRVAETVAGDVATTPHYGRAGIPETTTLTPKNTSKFPGENVQAKALTDLAGAPVVKTLSPGQNGDGGRSGLHLVRDEAGRVTEERRPDGKKTTFSYTASGQVKESVSPSGTKTAYSYNDTGQVSQIVTASADGKTTEKTGYDYDPHTGAITAVYDPDHRDTTQISYTYDADGRVTDAAYPDGQTVHREFDQHGQLKNMKDVAGMVTSYTYNPDGSLAEAEQREGDSPDSPVRASTAYTYDALGRIEKVDRGNGVVTEMQFTDGNQVKHEKTSKAGELISEASYTYDAHGNLTERTDERPEAQAGGTAGDKTKTTTRYSYDAYNRLLSSQVLDAQDQPLTSTTYELNVSGDITSRSTTQHTGDHAGKTTVTQHGIDTAGRLNTVTVDGSNRAQTFDDDGNLLTDHQGSTYTYNLRNQPVSLTTADGTTTRYTYWADGSRATSTASNAGEEPGTEHTTGFYYAPDGTLINDTHTTGGEAAVTASYLLAGTRQARVLTGEGADAAAATGAGYLLKDRHGNTTALTDTEGRTSQAWNYTDYGQAADSAGSALPAESGAHRAGAARNPFAYAGEYTNPNGTQYLKTRILDPSIQRFTTPDPAPRHNVYQAFGANPITNIDPQGTTEMPDWAGYFMMAASAAIALVSMVATAGASLAVAGVAIAGAVVDLASISLDAAAKATGKTRLEDDLNIAAIVVGSIGAAIGIGSGIAGIAGRLAARPGPAVVSTTASGISDEASDFMKKPPVANIAANLEGVPDEFRPAAIMDGNKQISWEVAEAAAKTVGDMPAEDVRVLKGWDVVAWEEKFPARAAAYNEKLNVPNLGTAVHLEPEANLNHKGLLEAFRGMAHTQARSDAAYSAMMFGSEQMSDTMRNNYTYAAAYWQQVAMAHVETINSLNPAKIYKQSHFMVPATSPYAQFADKHSSVAPTGWVRLFTDAFSAPMANGYV
ncbi:RHS repeat-associated core domain-containing protein [Streptomyces sp. NPDC096030]|uniref:RHS repeat domain-containing protein n=1 Tax=Streptomyces sp. NPDC096030 TaxID=3155423 RepID=UPI00333390FC